MQINGCLFSNIGLAKQDNDPPHAAGCMRYTYTPAAGDGPEKQ